MFSCYTNELKATCQKVVGFTSTILIIMGILTSILGYYATNDLPEALQKPMEAAGFDQEQMDINEEVAVPIMVLGIVIIFVGLLGCATCKFKNPMFAVPFGALNFIFALLFFIMAGLALGGPAVQDKAFSGICKEENKSLQTLSKYDALYVKNVDNLMCTSTCPCEIDDEDSGPKEKRYPFTLDDKLLRSRFGRTTKKLTTEEQTDYDTNGSMAKIVPLVSGKDGNEDGYETFQECYEAKLDKDAYKDDSKNAEFKAWVKDQGFSQMAIFEKDLKCQGLCKTPLFYSTQPFTDHPKDICFEAIKKTFSGSMKDAGYVAIVSAVIALLGFCGSFPLCSKPNDDEEEAYKD